MKKAVQKKFCELNVGEHFAFRGRRYRKTYRKQHGMLWWKSYSDVVDIDTGEELEFLLTYVLLDLLFENNDGDWEILYEPQILNEDTVNKLFFEGINDEAAKTCGEDVARCVEEIAERIESTPEPVCSTKSSCSAMNYDTDVSCGSSDCGGGGDDD